MEETIYDRFLSTKPVRSPGLRARIEDLVGLTGLRAARHRETWSQAIWPMVYLLTRPHLIAILLYTVRDLFRFLKVMITIYKSSDTSWSFQAVVFGFAIGINVTNGRFSNFTTWSLGSFWRPWLCWMLVVFVRSPPPLGYGLNQVDTSSLCELNHHWIQYDMQTWTWQSYFDTVLMIFACDQNRCNSSGRCHLRWTYWEVYERLHLHSPHPS